DVAAEQPVVRAGEGIDGPESAQHEVAERTGHKLPIGLQEDDLDGGIGHAHVARRRRSTPPAPDHHHAAAALRSDVPLDGAGAGGETAREAEAHGGGAKEAPARHRYTLAVPRRHRCTRGHHAAASSGTRGAKPENTKSGRGTLGCSCRPRRLIQAMVRPRGLPPTMSVNCDCPEWRISPRATPARSMRWRKRRPSGL